MVKYFTEDSTFPSSWEKITQIFWMRYPNPYSSHVLSEDVVNRKVVDGKLWTTRILKKTNRLPKWGERFIPATTKYVYLVEESILDPLKKTLVTYTRNIGLSHLLSVFEKCNYKFETPLTTLCCREMWAESKLYGLRRPIEKFAVERFKKNVINTAQGLNYVLEKTFPSKQPMSTIDAPIVKMPRITSRGAFTAGSVFSKVESS